MDWMLLPLRRYAQFSGRARPREYWMFVLFLILASIALAIIESIVGLGGGETARTLGDGQVGFSYQHDGSWLVGLFSLATFIPYLAVGIRRLYDTDRSGWWTLIIFFPFVGGIILLVFYIMSGTRGSNRFGPDPVEADPGR